AHAVLVRLALHDALPISLPDLQVRLNLAGEHNVQNALAAIAVAVELSIDDAAVLRALERFRGVGRRFQSYGDLPAAGGGRFTLIDRKSTRLNSSHVKISY